MFDPLEKMGGGLDLHLFLQERSHVVCEAKEFFRMELHQLQPATAQGGLPLRVAFRTLGCRLNQYDTESLKTTLSGLYAVTVVDWHAPAQVYILNSCTVTARADQECRRLARQIKRRHPDSKVIVVGCYAQTQPEVLAGMPEIDGVVGNAAKDDVGAWLPAILGDDVPTLQVQEFAPHPVFDSPLIEKFSGRSRALVKIQDGCNLRCTYCLIWRARGQGRSRTSTDVIAQLQRLVEQGYAETVLAGIHLGGYGHDLEDGLRLPALLAQCLVTLPQLRLRLSSIHPNEVTPQLLSVFRQHEHIRPHLHLSLQSGSSGVLARMKRPYRKSRVWESVRAVAGLRPDMGIGADVIVGFPGETAEEFAETQAMVAELPFSYLHVFRFSRRPGTAAAKMPDQIDARIIARRSQTIRAIAAQKKAAFARALIGSSREAVMESSAATSGWRQATTDNYVTVLVPEQGIPAGTLVQIRVAQWRHDQLYGDVDAILSPEQPVNSGVF